MVIFHCYLSSPEGTFRFNPELDSRQACSANEREPQFIRELKSIRPSFCAGNGKRGRLRLCTRFRHSDILSYHLPNECGKPDHQHMGVSENRLNP